MDRYSNLYGTVGTGGIYHPMGTSENLPAFLNKIGAVNPSATVEAVRNTLAGFPKMDHSTAGFRENYYSQPKNDLPVAVRYAPMHLYKRPDMPKSMQAFCALSVNGNENKQDGEDNRVTVYSQTFYIAREHMHEAVTVKAGGVEKRISYLDQIFGTKLLDHVQVADFRNGKATVDLDALPEKVTPKLNPRDQAVVFNTISAVFEGKSIVIRLEKGYGFNTRAWELLIPVYALMPPRLATEIGFATYQDPSAIRKMVTDTSIRIFVLPAECQLETKDTGDMLVMDLNNPSTIPPRPKDELSNMLIRWNKLRWEIRQEVMEKLFYDTETTFQDKTLFIQRSKEYFGNAFFAWERSDEDKGTIGTLEELKAKYDSFPLCADIPSARDSFVKKIPSLLKKGVTLKQLTADMLALALYSKDENEKKHAQQLYRFASELMSVDTIPYAKSAGKLVRNLTQAEDQIEMDKREAMAQSAIAAEKENTAKAVAAGAAALNQAKADADAAIAAEQKKTADAVAAGQAAVAAEKENTAKAVAAGQEALSQAKQERDAAVAAEQKKTADAVEAGLAAVAAEKENTAKAEAAGQEALSQAKKERDAAVAAEQQKAEQIKLVAAEKIKVERDAHQATQQKLDTEVQTHQATQQKLDQETQAHQATRQKLDAAQQEREGLNQRLEKAKEEYTKLKQAKAIADGKIEAAEKAKEEADQLAAKHQRLCDEVDARKAKYDAMIKKTNQRMIIFAAVGFLAASLIFGVIMLIVGLTGGEEPQQVTEPTATTEITEATDAPTEATELATEPSTEAPTEPTEPDLTNWTDETAAQWLQENVPGIREIQQTGLDQIPDEVKAIQDYSPVAVIRMETEQEETADQQFAVLLQRNAQADVDMAPMDSNLAQPEKEETSEELATAETQTSEPENPEETEATEAAQQTPSLIAAEVPGAKVVLTSDDFVMVVYGDDKSMTTALQIYIQIVDEDQEVLTRWNAGEQSLDLDKMFSQILMDNRWWASANEVSQDGAAVQEEIAVYAVDESALLRITCGESKVYVVECMNEFLADSLCEKLTQAGQIADINGNLVAFKAVTQ